MRDIYTSSFYQQKRKIMSFIRADKYLADCQIGTRTQVKKLIKQGKFSSESGVILDPDLKIDPSEKYFFDGKAIHHVEFEYYLLNKPSDCVCATVDNLHQTVMDYISSSRKDLFPVGRLDIDTTGILLITNDGLLAHDLLSPTKHVEKTYEALIDGEISQEDIDLFKEGFLYGEKKPSKPANLSIIQSGVQSLVQVTITEGKFHQVKRMFQKIDKKVISLKRISFGPLHLTPELSPGTYRCLTKEEIQQLKEK